MKLHLIPSLLFLANSAICIAQNDSLFNCKIHNKEHDIYIVMNLYDKDITIKDQEFMGEMPGYLGDNQDFRKWLIIESEIKKNTAQLQIINLEGSEDLTATLTHNKDNSYTLKQQEGSTLKIARNRKWKKLPKELIFTK